MVVVKLVRFLQKKVLFLLVFTCSILGLTNVNSFIREGKTRYTLGFIHPNTTAFYLFILACEYLYINRHNSKKYSYIIPLFYEIIIYFVTDSRTAFYVLFIIIVLNYIVKICNKKNIKIFDNKIIKIILKNSFFIFTIITIILTNIYIKGDSISFKLNNLTSGRLKLFSYFFENYNINLFGNVLNEYYVLDSSYLRLILGFGLITYLFYYIVFYKEIDFSLKNKDYTMVVILIGILIYGLTENSMYKSTLNVFILLFSNVIFKKDWGKIDEKKG